MTAHDKKTTDDTLTPGSAEYQEHVREEIEHYGRLYQDETARRRLMQTVPSAWSSLESRAASLIRSATGMTPDEHVVSRLRRGKNRMLSLGSGPGGVEIGFAQQVSDARIVCIDLNPDLLELGRVRSRDLGLDIEFQAGDLNTLILPEAEFDLVWCHASLHHVLELEHLSAQIRRSLRPGGELIIVDVITANGYRMWPDTRPIVQALFATLPPIYRTNHTAYGTPAIDAAIWESDTSTHGMECVRSEDIVAALDREFSRNHWVPYFALCRRFFDTMYGPNYDLERPLDRAIVECFWQLDRHYLESQLLRPETFFGIYSPNAPA